MSAGTTFRKLSGQARSCRRSLIVLRLAALALCLLLAVCSESRAEGRTVRIGVLANRGFARCRADWAPILEHLRTTLPQYDFQLRPLAFEDVDPAVESGELDFVVANPAVYVRLETRCHVMRVATLRNHVAGKSCIRFGGVVFTRAERLDIRSFQDLRGKTFAATSADSLGGWLAARGAFAAEGLEPSDFASLTFEGTHDGVIQAVLEGQAEAGTVRTDTLERLAAEGRLDPTRLRILPAQIRDPEQADFPFRVSTRLYPEWALAKLRRTPDELCKAVVAALFRMGESRAPGSRVGVDVTVPLDYGPVHDLLKSLRVAPYEHYGQVSPADFMAQNRGSVAAFALLLLVLAGVAVHMRRLNRQLGLTQQSLLRELEDRRQMEQALRESEEQFRFLAENAADVIWRLDADLRVIYISASDERLRGVPREEVLGKHVSVLFTEKSTQKLQQGKVERLLWESQGVVTGPVRYELQQVARDGQFIWVEINLSPMRDAEGRITGYHGVTRDITERKEAERLLHEEKDKLEETLTRLKRTEEALRQQASTDGLTGLLNRRRFDEVLKAEIARASRYGRPLTLVLLDIDHFKDVNDTYGHPVGDQVLVEVAGALSRLVRQNDYAARIGGEEFAVLLPETEADKASGLAERLRQEVAGLAVPAADGSPVSRTASLGLAGLCPGVASYSALYRAADQALYRAKQNGRNRVEGAVCV